MCSRVPSPGASVWRSLCGVLTPRAFAQTSWLGRKAKLEDTWLRLDSVLSPEGLPDCSILWEQLSQTAALTGTHFGCLYWNLVEFFELIFLYLFMLLEEFMETLNDCYFFYYYFIFNSYMFLYQGEGLLNESRHWSRSPADFSVRSHHRFSMLCW